MKSRTQDLKANGLYRAEFEHDACGIGFVANIKNKVSHQMVRDGMEMLLKLDHRAGKNADGTTGDGAGLMFSMPHKFFIKDVSFSLPEKGDYAVAMCFLPGEKQGHQRVLDNLNIHLKNTDLVFLGYRTVPVDLNVIDGNKRDDVPSFVQIFIGKEHHLTESNFLLSLYRVRKLWEKGCGEKLYVASMSPYTIVYKGMLTASQVPAFFIDFSSRTFQSSFVMVHSRFSTNTFPSWSRAHPNRYVAHNGEINTVRGNANDFKALIEQFKHHPFAEGTIEDLVPIIDEKGSDSQTFDAVLEFLLITGKSLPEALMMMIPEPLKQAEDMNTDLKHFYEDHSRLMSPWDGPMAIAFTNGRQIGAVLDRNGLRPGRYYLTTDDRLIFASEAGVIDIPPNKIKERHQLKPGELLYIDLVKQEWVPSHDIKVDTAKDYTKKTSFSRMGVSLLPNSDRSFMTRTLQEPLLFYQNVFGYTYEEVNKILLPMAEEGKEPTGAMGVDTPLAVLSEQPKLIYEYFKQWFSQVTNPPIDAIREALVISTDVWIGNSPEWLSDSPESTQQVRLAHPILTQMDIQKLEHADFIIEDLDLTINIDAGTQMFEDNVQSLIQKAETAIQQGATLIRLTDHQASIGRVAIPALWAISALHQHLITVGLRRKVSLIIQTGEARDSHQMAMLLSFGADAIYPYLGLQSILHLTEEGHLQEFSQAEENYVQALVAGIVKIMSKVGISCISSFQGAQTFEALGLSQSFLDCYFTGCISQLNGIGADEIERETRQRHDKAIQAMKNGDFTLPEGSRMQWRKEGEPHMFQPMAIHTLQQAARRNDPKLYQKFTEYIDKGPFTTIRSLLNVHKMDQAIDLNEVEPVESIFKRFKTGAMSYGALSQEAHETLAIAMNRIGGKSNSGEGGEAVSRFAKERNGDWKRSAIKQVASGRFGVTSRYLAEADEIQIKMAQGAKPGEGGQLPGKKVYPWIAEVRSATPGVGLISPPPHHDIYSIEDLAQLIYDLKQANPHARISVKLVAKAGVGTIAAGVAKGLADVILISGHDGGTGASPVSSIQHAGLPWEIGLAEVHQTLLLNELRDKVILETDGKLMTGQDVVIAACLGAEEFGFSTAPLIVMGCIMMRACHLDTCPVGVATQNPELRKKFMGTPDHIVNYLTFIAEDIRKHLAQIGAKSLDEVIGRSDLLFTKPELKDHPKAKHLNLEPMFGASESIAEIKQHHGNQAKDLVHFDERYLLQNKTNGALTIFNTDRTVGTRLGYAMTVHEESSRKSVQCIGSAGQSFGAFIPEGLRLTLYGDANDYTGKGLSGGELVIQPDERWLTKDNQAIVGNVALYGATSGRAFIRGRAGQRFAVRNSGAEAVVEGIGDHGCEYMTGGKVIVLGSIGKNFAAGMSGGIAYLLDDTSFYENMKLINQELVDLKVGPKGEDARAILNLLQMHFILTGSPAAKRFLENWQHLSDRIIKVVPREYNAMHILIEDLMREGKTQEEAKLEAFYLKKSGKEVAIPRSSQNTAG